MNNTAPANAKAEFTVFMRAIVNDSGMNKMIADAARATLTGAAFPEELADLFTLEVITRPNGSQYVIVDFA
jgi:hypothetical protein